MLFVFLIVVNMVAFTSSFFLSRPPMSSIKLGFAFDDSFHLSNSSPTSSPTSLVDVSCCWGTEWTFKPTLNASRRMSSLRMSKTQLKMRKFEDLDIKPDEDYGWYIVQCIAGKERV